MVNSAPGRALDVPGAGSGRLVQSDPLCVIELPLGAPEAAVLRLDDQAVAGAPAELRAALAESNVPALVLVDPQCPPAQLDRVIAAAGLADCVQLDDAEIARPVTGNGPARRWLRYVPALGWSTTFVQTVLADLRVLTPWYR